MKWSKGALNILKIIDIGINVAEKIKGVEGPAKARGVIDGVKQAEPAIEALAPVDLHSEELDVLMANYISSKIALQNFVTKKAAPEGVMLPVAPTP